MNNLIILYEPAPEIEHILRPLTTREHFNLLTTRQGNAVPLLMQQKKPHLVILNGPDTKHACHRLKMDPDHFFIPVFVVTEAGENDFELEFLANEIFPRPFSENRFLKTVHNYLEELDDAQDSFREQEKDLQTLTRDKWIEQKSHQSYFFEYNGTIDQSMVENLTERVRELVTIGRKDFTVQLINARHIDNIAPALFIRIQKIIKQADGHLKLIMGASRIAAELQKAGLDIDEYIQEDLNGLHSAPDNLAGADDASGDEHSTSSATQTEQVTQEKAALTENREAPESRGEGSE